MNPDWVDTTEEDHVVGITELKSECGTVGTVVQDSVWW